MDGFRNFVTAFGAADRLLTRAHANGSLIEGMVLFVSMIDGLLRIALVLDKQLAGQEADLYNYIEQGPDGKKFTERQIFEEAHRRGLLNDDLRAEIDDLYQRRNAVIHRFFLTDIRYADLPPLLDRYARVFDQCYAVVDGLETRQVAEGTGMTVAGPFTVQDRADVHWHVGRKLGFAQSRSDRPATAEDGPVPLDPHGS